MDGAAALRYARLRPDNSSDLERIDRQTQVITAIQEKLYRPEILRTLPELMTALQGSAFTDLSPSEIQRLVCLGEQIAQAGFITVEIDSDMTTSVMDEFGYERLQPDAAAIRSLAAAFQSGDLS